MQSPRVPNDCIKASFDGAKKIKIVHTDRNRTLFDVITCLQTAVYLTQHKHQLLKQTILSAELEKSQ